MASPTVASTGNNGAIIGGIVGGVLGAVVIAAIAVSIIIILYFCNRSENYRPRSESTSNNNIFLLIINI